MCNSLERIEQTALSGTPFNAWQILKASVLPGYSVKGNSNTVESCLFKKTLMSSPYAGCPFEI